jgi:hypothetical protein
MLRRGAVGLNLMGDFIREALVSTLDAAGQVHLTPLGYRQRDGRVLLAPFHPSQTLANLQAHGVAVLNFIDDVSVIAGCLTGRRTWPVTPAERVAVPRLAQSLAHWELEVIEVFDDATRPTFECQVVLERVHAPFTGFNRAQAAVIEAAVLVSRLDWLDPVAVRDDFSRLQTAIDKTAGPRERQGWDWLCAALAQHPRHRDTTGMRG